MSLRAISWMICVCVQCANGSQGRAQKRVSVAAAEAGYPERYPDSNSSLFHREEAVGSEEDWLNSGSSASADLWRMARWVTTVVAAENGPTCSVRGIWQGKHVLRDDVLLSQTPNYSM